MNNTQQQKNNNNKKQNPKKAELGVDANNGFGNIYMRFL